MKQVASSRGLKKPNLLFLFCCATKKFFVSSMGVFNFRFRSLTIVALSQKVLVFDHFY